jgi:adenylate cyclase
MRHLNRHWRRITLSLIPLVVFFCHVVGLMPLGVVDRIDAMLYDAHMRAAMPQTFDDRIVIVDVDEKSLAEVGRWPWSRNYMATLTDVLFDQQHITLLGFDVVFAEPDDSSGLKQLQSLAKHTLSQDPGFLARLEQLTPSLDYDGTFAKALANRPVVMGYFFTSDQAGLTSGVLPKPIMSRPDFKGFQASVTEWSGFGANLDLLVRAAPLAGFFNSLTDADGVVRALPLVVRYADNYYESLALAMFRQLIGLPQVLPGLPDAGLSGSGRGSLPSVVLKWPDKTLSIPLDARGAVRVPFRGHGGVTGGSFAYVSASDVLTGRLPPDLLKGKIVLVGTTATGSVDLRATPVAATYPGVEVHANVLSSLLDQRYLVKPEAALGYEVVLLLSTGLALAFFLPLLRASVGVVVSVVLVLALVGLHWWLYFAYGWVLSVVPVLLMSVSVFVINVGYGYLGANRSRRELIALFGTYVPPELVQEMIRDPDHYNMRAKSEELTVMFCDLRGFTQMSERMDPLELQKLLNQVFSELTGLIGANRGTVDKYMGDCVMAFWGAPVASPMHAQLAVKTAMQMAQALGRINQTYRAGAAANADLVISLGIGVNTGQMYVGDMGSNIRRSYTVIGDAVNLGSRLEGLSKIYGVSIVVSETTKGLVSGVVWQELDRVRVKGKQQAVTIFTPVALEGDLLGSNARELSLWHDFLAAYRSQNRIECDALMGQLLQYDAAKPLYKLYADRLTLAHGQIADPAWDGATTFETK